jgi:hypothetical protein
MSDLVPTEDIERIVGAKRHATKHQAKAVSAEQKVFILHSRKCLDSGIDLRDCRFSWALDNGIRLSEWQEDVAFTVRIQGSHDGMRLVPSSVSS